MQQRDLWTVIGRAKTDAEFAGQLFSKGQKALADNGYKLEEGEVETLKMVLNDRMSLEADGARAKLERMKELMMYTVTILKETLGNAARTYKTISRMNVTMFVMGIVLFLFASLYAVFSQEKIYSLVFGGLGTISFIGLFLLGPIQKSQNALSNLVQVEISFLNYFEQITFWENYALSPNGMPNPENIEKASEMLQTRSREIIDMLQNYVESGNETPKT